MILFCLILIKLEQFEKVVHDSMLSYFCKTRVRCGKLELVAPVAQWIRASVFGTEGRGFESLRVYQIGVSRFLLWFLKKYNWGVVQKFYRQIHKKVVVY